MILDNLSLVHFRNHQKKRVEFSPALTILVGENGAGKTNILEALYLLARGESWRAEDASEMVEFGEEVGHVGGETSDSDISFSRVARAGESSSAFSPLAVTRSPSLRSGSGMALRRQQARGLQNLISDSRGSRLHVVLTRGIVQGKRVAKVKYNVDGVARQKSTFVGQLKVVLFEPESLEIIIGDPGKRRGFLDEALSQTNSEYVRSLGIYQKALRTRNKVLDAIREGRARVESLEYWEREMMKHGGLIQQCRQAFIEWLDGLLHERIEKDIPENVTRSRSEFRNILVAQPVAQSAARLHVAYEPSQMSEERLDQYRDREIAAGFTLIGPQRDDIKIGKRFTGQQAFDPEGLRPEWVDRLKDAQPASFPTFQPLSSFGSRGEQRMAVLKLKLLEAEWIEKETGASPIILLDDIFSELDREHEELVGKLIDGRQTMITATEVPKSLDKNTKIIELV